MDQSKQALYENTLYLTTGIFVFLMCVATSSPALMPRSQPADLKAETANASPTIGRFIVTPSTARPVTPVNKTSNQQQHHNAE